MHLREQYYLDQIKKDKEESAMQLEEANDRYEALRRSWEAHKREVRDPNAGIGPN